MNSKQTDSDGQQKKTMPEDWSPVSSAASKTKLAKPTAEEAKLQEMMDEGIVDGNHPNRSVGNEHENSMGADSSIQSENRTNAADSLQTELTDEARLIVPKRISGKQRKESLEEYRETFLQIPKLEDRKPVFISREVRDNLDEIARKLGGRRMSVSGFIENLARHHLETYQDDIEMWKKL